MIDARIGDVLDDATRYSRSYPMADTKPRYKLVRIPVPPGHRPRPNARVTPRDRSIARDYLACKGDVASVRDAHGISQSGLQYIIGKMGVWKRWIVAAPPRPRCGVCHRTLHDRHQRHHWDCRRRAREAETARLVKRARKLLATGLTAKATAARIGRSAPWMTAHLPGVALTNEQRRRRGLPPAEHERRLPDRDRPRSRGQRKVDWVLVDVPVPRSFRGRPPERLDALERRAVTGYLACRGDVQAVFRRVGRSSEWLRLVLQRAQVWRRWKKRPAPRPPCVTCGRPLPNLRPGSRHLACSRKEKERQRKAWVARAKALLAKGWTLERVAESVSRHINHVSAALPGHAQAPSIRLAESDARLRRYARLVKSGLSRREAGQRVGFAPTTSQTAYGRAVRKGYL